MAGTRRVEQGDFRALWVDGLAIELEVKIVEFPAGQIDRAVDDRRIDRYPFARSDGCFTRLVRRLRGGRRLNLSGLQASLILLSGLGLLSRLSLLRGGRRGCLVKKATEKILPSENDRHRESDGQDEIFIVGAHEISVSAPRSGRRVEPLQGCRNVILKA